MFDEVSQGWPKHDCFNSQFQKLKAKVLPIISAGADPASASFKPFKDLKAFFSPAVGNVESPEGAKQAQAKKPARSSVPNAIIKRMDPMPGEMLSFIGRVHDIAGSSKHLGALYTLGDLGLKLLGLPPKSFAVQITLVDHHEQLHESYTAVADSRKLTGVEVGVMVWVILEGKVSGNASAWIVSSLDAI